MITQDLQKQIAEAMKAKDTVRLATLKLLSSELHNEWIAKQHELSEDEEFAVVRREVKKRKDAADAYEKVGRADRAEVEKQEMAILQEFLPAEMSDEELNQLISDSINQINATGMQDLGKVIGLVKSRVGAKADGARIAGMVKQKLS
ncbi:hypothetical protein A2803_05005 [Candidatus Woesebacteria bacterium RIFCSPHIGHO2_01_FULL_44_21]|uniref:Glutamyl-tRNA amidotransferase n=1 Tax=Candidatus Woesebacteria bacterium RIFCSPHIGHO2_01_FULL_44_21 TaxID=1802503 RepID=A0A1F7YZX7_9BACT|nr:MAG: hypothetical protein A2803_05005 [Candidatus Woesebacteria bacterium RIFCSPHIGHO2_01_FULL_44_21]OGM68906.1 MAG: hypothetical protein A2897_01970 [Candidatus Woesebacteria bacterium RIFCSPLOWO2_01_FULL_44_24b]